MAKNELSQWKKILDSIGCTLDTTPTTKEENFNTIVTNMLQIVLSMFEYKGLSEDINGSPWWYRDLRMFTDGYVCCFPYKGKHYATPCGLGGIPDVNYLPTIATIANPYLNLNESMVIDKDCVIFKNDRLYQGIMPWCKLYAWQMAEAVCTLRIGLINSRAENLISVDDDNQAQGALQFIKDLEDGLHIAHLVASTKNNFLGKDSNNSLPYSANAINTIRSAIESLQYLFSSWCSGMGIQMSFNTKREYVSSEETTLGEQVVVPRVEQMLECRKEAVNRYNRLFGTNISVDYSSIWKDRVIIDKTEKKIMEKEANEGTVPNRKDEDKETKDENKSIIQNNE